jgi:putative transposase
MTVASNTISPVLRTLLFRIYPNRDQVDRLNAYIDQSRHCYNQALEQRIHARKPNGKGIDYPTQQKQLTLQRKADPAMAATPLQVQRDGLRRLDAGFKNFFRRCREGAKRKGFPKFKSAARYNSFTLANGYNAVKDGRVSITGIKPIRCRGLQPCDHKPRRITVTRRADKWFARILIDDQTTSVPKRPIKKTVGIDMGLNHFLATSDGKFIDCPKHYRRLQPALRRAQRLLSRRKKGSKRRGRALIRVQRIHQKIADCRDDFTHKLSKKLVAEHDFSAAEKLNIKGMVRSNLAKSILDAGWAMFLFRVAYKAANAGATFEQGNPAGTSQECSGCGESVPKSLSERVHRCKCGLVLDRDVNAARNVLFRALKRISTPGLVKVGTREEGSTSTSASVPSQAVPSIRAD